MVKLTPPPDGVQDRQVYDYLYQLQEYLGTVLNDLSGVSTPAAAAETDENSTTTRSWVIRTTQDLREAVSQAITGLENELDAYLTKTDAIGTYLSKSDAADVYLTKTDATGLYLTQSGAAETYLTKTDFSTFSDDMDAAIQTLETDYVVQRGTDGAWSWRVWSSGDVQLWGHWNLTAGEAPGTRTIPWPTGFTGSIAFVEAGDPNGTSVEIKNVVSTSAGVRFSLTAGADPVLPAVDIAIIAHGAEVSA